MVKPVDRLVEDFLVAGADYITVHQNPPNTCRTLSMITAGGPRRVWFLTLQRRLMLWNP